MQGWITLSYHAFSYDLVFVTYTYLQYCGNIDETLRKCSEISTLTRANSKSDFDLLQMTKHVRAATHESFTVHGS